MENIYQPFESFDDMLCFFFLRESFISLSLPSLILKLNDLTKKKFKEIEIKNFISKISLFPQFFPDRFFKELKQFEKFVIEKMQIFSSDVDKCLLCYGIDFKINFSKAKFFSLNNGSRECLIENKSCLNCKASFSLSFYSTKEKRLFYQGFLSNQFISFSNETVFEVLLLDKLTCDIIFKRCSFQSFVNSYNYFNQYYLKSLVFLQEKRLIETWYFYKLTKTKLELNPNDELTAPFVYEIDICLEKTNRMILPFFIKKWSGEEHRLKCLNKNCSHSISVDGNHKINRLKCFYSNVSISSPEFGLIETDCPNTPAINSYFCEAHLEKDPQCRFRYDDRIFLCNLSQIKCSFSHTLANKNKIKIYDSFIDKNDKVLYLVDYSDKNPFWATENQIPFSIRNRFIKSLKFNDDLCNTNKAFTLPCNKKLRTVGVFAGVYNCGIVCGFKEIFKSESIKQTANFIFELIESLDRVPEYWTYDDGCRLRKFLNNKKNFTQETQRQKLSVEKTIFVDRFHIRGHSEKDVFCKNFCDPSKESKMNEINTSAAEQLNFWLSSFKHITKHMNKHRFKFFIYTILDERNKANLLMKFDGF